MTGIEQLLQELYLISGVIAVRYCREDGEVVKGMDRGELADTRLAPIISFMLAESGSIAHKIGKDSVSMVYIEFQESILISAPLNDASFLIIVAKPAVNIAKIGLAIKNQKAAVSPGS